VRVVCSSTSRLSMATDRLVAAPVQLDNRNAKRIYATPRQKKRSDGDVPKQNDAADIGAVSLRSALGASFRMSF